MKTVPLHGKIAAGRVALVSDRDYRLVSQYRWRVTERKFEGRRPDGPYAVTTITKDGRRTLLQMHSLITGYPLTDHKNHNGLDNRRSNLRPATNSQNQQNRQPNLRSTSQYKGVHWSTRERRWRATIKHEGTARTLGNFIAEEQAALAYDAAARSLFGEYAVLNFPASRGRAGRTVRRRRGSYEAHRDRIRALVRATAAQGRSSQAS